ncbi:hypothetical protein GYMLUDRAFT_249952 [Collybiopsis luxurians FD-317 M1]|uniref:Uncharacterized protein n=1 Tax=Collybiopsis luxurians FD-317 M1 TaxID=944289 RepID=A0A0D0BW73_9AGAR|nr:hypothetical protein GYMLUDRAFT_249952 [Collybiopsis luxurians FD-317 M1]
MPDRGPNIGRQVCVPSSPSLCWFKEKFRLVLALPSPDNIRLGSMRFLFSVFCSFLVLFLGLVHESAAKPLRLDSRHGADKVDLDFELGHINPLTRESLDLKEDPIKTKNDFDHVKRWITIGMFSRAKQAKVFGTFTTEGGQYTKDSHFFVDKENQIVFSFMTIFDQTSKCGPRNTCLGKISRDGHTGGIWATDEQGKLSQEPIFQL